MVSLTCLIGQDRRTYRGATHANISLITRWNIKSSLPTPRRHHKMIRHINRKLTAACCSVAVLLLLMLAALYHAGDNHMGMMAPAVTMFTKLLPLLNAGAKPSELRCGVSLLIMLVCFGASAILKWLPTLLPEGPTSRSTCEHDKTLLAFQTAKSCRARMWTGENDSGNYIPYSGHPIPEAGR